METLSLNSSGPMVELLQSVLKKLDFYTGSIDGVYGNQTYLAVRRYQRNFGLTIDGVVGATTWDSLAPYLNGYTSYIIQAGDTYSTIATQFNTTVNAIQYANPNLDPSNLSIGTNLIVPFGEIVPTDIQYSYPILQLNLSALKKVYPFLSTGRIGYSVLGNSLSYVRIGNGSKEIFYSASIHANEWITSVVLMKFIEDFCMAYVNQTPIYDRNAESLFNRVSLYLVPMCNPDGVNLVTGSLSPDTIPYRNTRRIANNYPDIPFPSGWKANIVGTDLNLQFPAGWENAREIKFAQGYTSPAPRDYVGASPLLQPEARALYHFTLAHNFTLILAYHTQGEVIYWRFQDYLPPNSRQIGEQFSQSSGYELEDTPPNSSFAGYKDWFIQTYNRPGYTIEAGLGENPLPISQFDKIYHDNIGILTLGMEISP